MQLPGSRLQGGMAQMALKTSWTEPRTILVYDIKTWKVLHKLDCKARPWATCGDSCSASASTHKVYTVVSNSGKCAGQEHARLRNVIRKLSPLSC